MSVIATISVPAEGFVLGRTLAEHPGVVVRLERVVPVGDAAIPYLWARNDDVETVRAALVDADDVGALEILDEVDGEALVRIEWAEGVDGYLDAIAAAGGTIIEGRGEGDSWRLQLRFDGSERLREFYGRCEAEELPVEVETIHDLAFQRAGEAAVDLTDAQREALAVALEAGYFDVPRGIDLVGLAEELGVSDSAVSQRLRRGTEAVLAATIGEADDRDPP